MKIKTFVGLATIGMGAYFFSQCKHIQKTEYDIVKKKIPDAFDGFKIVQLSDLHNCYFGSRKHNYLIWKINEINPDIILITGDFFDVEKYENSLMIIEELSKKYELYFTPGGHEYYVPEYAKIKSKMQKMGVEILENKRIEVIRDNESIYVTGITDPTFYNGNINYFKNILKKLESNNKFHILLSHRPDLFKEYTDCKYDLTFCGHAHGGQIKIGNKGLYAPNQGILPKYTSGIHTRKRKSMIVNRGIGWHSLFVKINNRPEIVVVSLKKQ